MMESGESNPFPEPLEQEQRDKNQNPPREEPEERLQIPGEFNHLYVERFELKRYGEEEIVGEELYHDRREIEVKPP